MINYFFKLITASYGFCVLSAWVSCFLSNPFRFPSLLLTTTANLPIYSDLIGGRPVCKEIRQGSQSTSILSVCI